MTDSLRLPDSPPDGPQECLPREQTASHPRRQAIVPLHRPRPRQRKRCPPLRLPQPLEYRSKAHPANASVPGQCTRQMQSETAGFVCDKNAIGVPTERYLGRVQVGSHVRACPAFCYGWPFCFMRHVRTLANIQRAILAGVPGNPSIRTICSFSTANNAG